MQLSSTHKLAGKKFTRMRKTSTLMDALLPVLSDEGHVVVGPLAKRRSGENEWKRSP